MARSQLTALAERVLALEKARLRAKQPNLGHSTIDGGAIQATDGMDTLTMIVGQQFDQTSTASVVTGPTPPAPIVPFLTPQPGAMRIYWDGTFVGGAVAPMDFARVLAYAVPSASFVSPDPLNQANIVGQFTSATGGELTAALDPGVEYVVYLVTWSQAGKFSIASDAALATVGVQVDESYVDSAISSKNSIYRQPTQPWPDGDLTHPDDAGDLWIDTSMGPGLIFDVDRVSVTAGEVTLVLTTDEHDILAGNLVQVTGVSDVLDGSWAIDTVTGEVLTYAVDPLLAPDEADHAVAGATAQGQDVKALNRPNIWDGTNWVVVQDSGAEAAATLQDDLKGTQQTVAEVSITATNAYATATLADGRVAISDYEPTGDDVEGKTDGSLWITRTRDRLNLCLNPNFSAGVDEWSAVFATVAQATLVAPTDIGGYAAEITNDTNTALLHYIAPTNAAPINPAEQMIVSGYARLVSGLGADCFAFIDWYDVSGNLLGTTNGESVNLAIGDTGWVRLYAAGVAPDATDHAIIGFGSPGQNASDVWQVQGVLIEQSDRLGRYFDGDSEGGIWNGTPELSDSTLDGGAIIRLFNLEDGSWSEKFWTADTISSVDVKVLRSSKDYERPDSLDDYSMDGALLGDNTVAVDKLYAPSATANEALFAGALVNITQDNGVPIVRLARADIVNAEANGFVLQAANIGDIVPVYTTGYDPLLTGMTPGSQFLSTTPGQVSSSAPQATGTIIQRVGNAVSPTVLDFAPLTSIALI